MRLPWPFGRSTSGDGASSTSGADAGSGTPAAAPASPPIPAPIPPTGAWRTLPPIQRTAGPPPVVAPAAPFLARVPGHTALPPIVTPLGHDSSPGAPAGIVVAHPHAVPSLTSATPLTNRPVQRHAATNAAATDGAATVWDEAAPVVSRAADPMTAADVPAASPTREPELPPIRTIAPVTAAATVTPSPRPLTQASPTLAPLPLSASRASGGTADASRGSRPAALSLPIQASGRIPASATGPAGTPEAARPAPAPIRRFTELPVEGPRPAAQRETGAPRRAGLGAPMTVPPASATAQRMPIASSTSSAQPAMREPAAAAPGAAPADPVSHSHAAAPGAPRPLPVLTVARKGRDESPTAARTPAPAIAGGPARATAVGARPTVSRSASSVLPTVGARPLRPSISPAPPGAGRPAATDAGGSTSADDPPAPVLARWDSGDALPATVTSLTTAPAPERGLPVQLSPIEGASTGGSAPRQTPPAMREIVFPARDSGSEPSIYDAGGWPAPASGPAQTAANTAHPASPVRPAPTPLTLARSLAPAPAPAPVAAPSAATPVVARIVADPASPGAQPVVQTSPAGRGVQVATFTATPVVQREEATAPPAQPERAGRSDRELDELAKQLFGRIRGQLKAEVIHEREAKGLTFDAF